MSRLTPTLLRGFLGILKTTIGQVQVIELQRKIHDGVLVRRVDLGEERIPALILCREDFPKRTGAGVLYCHAHGNRYDVGKSEVIKGRPAMLEPPLGLVLARAGATVICPDLPGFGDRRSEGTESALAKAMLWEGRTLIGRMLCDLEIAHRALMAEAGVDTCRIACIGFSMGATLASCYMAVNTDIHCCAGLCAFSGIQGLIQVGAHDLHGIYMTIPGLLPEFDMDDIVGLGAPRPQLICTGMDDPLTPGNAYDSAITGVIEAYRGVGAEENLICLREEGVGHLESRAMRRLLLGFLQFC